MYILKKFIFFLTTTLFIGCSNPWDEGIIVELNIELMNQEFELINVENKDIDIVDFETKRYYQLTDKGMENLIMQIENNPLFNYQKTNQVETAKVLKHHRITGYWKKISDVKYLFYEPYLDYEFGIHNSSLFSPKQYEVDGVLDTETGLLFFGYYDF